MRTKSYFISDLHLGAPYIANPRAHEARIVRWLDSIQHDARHLFLLGDIMDYWYEYRTVAPRGHLRFLGALARLADAGCEIVWLTGNHDVWIFDYLPSEIGLKVVDGAYRCTIDGRHFLLEHGDGVGKIDRGYKMMRSVFRNRFCQLLYGAVHPRWTVAFARRWSRHSRQSSPCASKELVRQDMLRLHAFASHTNATSEHVDYFIFGHLHIPAREMVGDASDSELIVLGDCYRTFSYAEWDGATLMIKSITE